MALNYYSSQKEDKGSEKSIGYFSDLFALLCFIFLFLYVISTLQQNLSSLNQNIKSQKVEKNYDQKIKNIVQEYEKQMVVFQKEKEEYIKQHATKEQKNTYEDVLEKLKAVKLKEQKKLEAYQDLMDKTQNKIKNIFSLNKQIENIAASNLVASAQIKKLKEEKEKIKKQKEQEELRKKQILEEMQKKVEEKEKQKQVAILNVKKQTQDVIQKKEKELKQKVKKVQEMAISMVKQTKEEMTNKYEQKITEQDKNYKEQINTIQKQTKEQLQKQKQDWQKEIEAKDQQMSMKVQEFQDKITTQEQQYKQQITTQEQQYKQQITTQDQQYKQKIAQQEQQYQQEISQKVQKYEQQIQKQGQQHQQEMTSQDQNYKQQINSLQKASQDQLQKQNALWQSELQSKEQNWQAKTNELQQSLSQNKDAFAQFKSAAQAKEDQLKQDMKNALVENTAALTANFDNQMAEADSQHKKKYSGLKDKYKAAVEDKWRLIDKVNIFAEPQAKLVDRIHGKLTEAFKKAGIEADVNPTSGEVTIKFRDTFFDFDKSDLKDEMKDQVAKLFPIFAKTILGDRSIARRVKSFDLIGYASPVYGGGFVYQDARTEFGRRALKYNMDLSYQRAQSIFHYVFNPENVKFKYQRSMLRKTKVISMSHLGTKLKRLLPEYDKSKHFCENYDCQEWQKTSIRFNFRQPRFEGK